MSAAYGTMADSMLSHGVGSVGGRSSTSGPAPSSLAGGSLAAGGYTDGSRSIMGPSASSPAGGSLAAAGVTDGSRSSVPSRGGLMSAAGYGQAADSMLAGGIGSVGGRNYGLAPAASAAEDESMAKNNAIEGLIGAVLGVEASKSAANPYNSVVYDWAPFEMTKSTLGQTKAFQAQMLAEQKARGIPADERSTAIGLFQTIAPTLDAVAKDIGLTDDTVMTESVQNQIGLALAEARAAKATDENGVVDPLAFANELAKEWAGFANETGNSHYDGKGKIKPASTSPACLE